MELKQLLTLFPGRYLYRIIQVSKYINSIHGLISKIIEYILEWNLVEKSVKRPFCCTVSIVQVYFTYLCYITFWALEYHFIENLKVILKENQIYEIG